MIRSRPHHSLEIWGMGLRISPTQILKWNPSDKNLESVRNPLGTDPARSRVSLGTDPTRLSRVLVMGICVLTLMHSYDILCAHIKRGLCT